MSTNAGGGRRWELLFDGMPPGPNARPNYHARARVTRYWRECAAVYARHVYQVPPLPRVRLSAVFFRRTIGVADEDNDRARLKPLVDGLRDAGVIPNDTRGFVEWGAVTEVRGHPGVRLIVEAIEPAPAGQE